MPACKLKRRKNTDKHTQNVRQTSVLYYPCKILSFISSHCNEIDFLGLMYARIAPEWRKKLNSWKSDYRHLITDTIRKESNISIFELKKYLHHYNKNVFISVYSVHLEFVQLPTSTLEKNVSHSIRMWYVSSKKR